MPLLLFQDPYLQAAVAAAAAAETAAAEAAYAAPAEPEKVDASSFTEEALAEEAAALNPLHLEPMVLAAARHATDAILSELQDGDLSADLLAALTAGGTNGSTNGSTSDPGLGRTDAAAVPGSLDFYLYGDNAKVDSGKDYGECSFL